MDGTENNRLRLDDFMNERRLNLRIKTWAEVARRAGMTPENLRKIRRGEISISENAADGIERAMDWGRGSVERIVMQGKEPAVLSGESPTPTREADDDEWTTEDEIFFETISARLSSWGLRPTREIIEKMREEYERLAIETRDDEAGGGPITAS